jgi:VWFA-related protein
VPKFTARSELVLVPVVVTGRSRAPVLGLQKEDFKVFENGKEQPIKVFEEAHPEAARVTRPVLPANEFSNVLTSSSPQRLEIIVLDAVNTPFLDQAYARDQLVEYLAHHLEPGTLVSLLVMNWRGVRVVHDFTTDTAPLIAALRNVTARKSPMERLEPDSTPPAGTNQRLPATEMQALRDFVAGADASIAAHQQDLATGLTLEAFEHIAQAYAGIPGRKSLIWATASFPFNIGPDNSAMEHRNYSDQYQHALQMLSSANIAVYPVDVRGLLIQSMPVYELANMRNFASMTGGRAFYNRNDVDIAVQEAAHDSWAYYMLGYYLDAANTTAGWHKLKVQVLRKGVEVRSRAGFFVTRPPDDPEAARKLDINMATASPLDYSSLPLTLRWKGTEPHGEKRRVLFEAVLPANAATVDEEDGNHVSLEFIAVARTGKGEDAGHFDQVYESRVKPAGAAQIRASGLTYRGALDLAPGDYRVRLVVRDALNGRIGSVGALLKVE